MTTAMPGIIEYIIKLNICFGVVYLFYRLLLRPLTFYNWNRWYLLGYTALSFVIPLVNVMPSLQKQHLHDTAVLQWIPVVSFANTAQSNFLETLTGWDWLIGAMALGSLVLLLRLATRLYSFYRIKAKAQLISGGGTKIYQLNENITPFSFGNSIFINADLNSGDELEEIIRHEFVHIKQKHSIDIIWCELVCILNWFNPFVWMLRHSVRQNLEFIADDKVLQNGVDKTAYQYLLLKVVGHPQFAFTNHFNFSSLKKRIAMMNTLKTARIHLARFVFLLPVIAVLLLSFRNEKKIAAQNPGYTPVETISLIPGTITLQLTAGITDTLPKPGQALEITDSGRSKTLELTGIRFDKEPSEITIPDSARHIIVLKQQNAVSTHSTAKDTIIVIADSVIVFTSSKKDTVKKPLEGMAFTPGANPEPLYIIDGVEISPKGMQKISPYHIESISVLKGEDVTAIYGPKAANGVILITTKSTDQQKKTATVTGYGQVQLKQGDVAITADSINFTTHAPPKAIGLRFPDTVEGKPGKENVMDNLPDDIYYILNGEKANRKKIKKLKGEDIKSMDVLKGEQAVRFYGKKAKNGAIVITTKR